MRKEELKEGNQGHGSEGQQKDFLGRLGQTQLPKRRRTVTDLSPVTNTPRAPKKEDDELNIHKNGSRY